MSEMVLGWSFSLTETPPQAKAQSRLLLNETSAEGHLIALTMHDRLLPADETRLPDGHVSHHDDLRDVEAGSTKSQQCQRKEQKA